MKVILVNSNYSPAVSDFIQDKLLHPDIIDLPLGLLSLAAVLERNNCRTKIVDLPQFIKKKRINIDKNFHREAAKIILKENFDVLGFNTRCDTYASVLNIAGICKESRPRAKVLLGGPQASFVDEETLKNFSFVDVIARGESELTLLDLIQHLKNKEDLKDVPGITYRANGKIIRNKERDLIADLDLLPLPAYHLINEYFENQKSFRYRYIPIHTGRGCSYNCTFCIASLMNQKRCRFKTPENILREIKFLKKKHGINYFVFSHDNFLDGRKNAEKLCRLLKKEKLKIYWGCNARVNKLDSKLLRMISESGCNYIFLGVESASLRIRKSIGKNLNVSRMIKILEECERSGIKTILSFIVGFPEEREDDINETIELAFRSYIFFNCSVQFHLLAPFAGTRIFEENKEKLVFTGLLSDMVSGPLAQIEENMGLIRKYPLIFSGFYTLKPKYLPLNFPYQIADTFSKISRTHPVSCYITMKELKLRPVVLLKELKKWMGDRNPESQKETAMTTADFRGAFSRFLKYIYNRKGVSFNLVKGIIDFENAYNRRPGISFGLQKESR